MIGHEIKEERLLIEVIMRVEVITHSLTEIIVFSYDCATTVLICAFTFHRSSQRSSK